MNKKENDKPKFTEEQKSRGFRCAAASLGIMFTHREITTFGEFLLSCLCGGLFAIIPIIAYVAGGTFRPDILKSEKKFWNVVCKIINIAIEIGYILLVAYIAYLLCEKFS